jgi:hypothetical protein
MLTKEHFENIIFITFTNIVDHEMNIKFYV